MEELSIFYSRHKKMNGDKKLISANDKILFPRDAYNNNLDFFSFKL